MSAPTELKTQPPNAWLHRLPEHSEPRPPFQDHLLPLVSTLILFHKTKRKDRNHLYAHDYTNSSNPLSMSTSLPDSSANVDWYWASFHVMTQNGDWTTLTTTQRFGLVSSLYGPGNLACWFCLIVSVAVSWTVNPSTRRKDSITNDFIAVLTMPVVAAGHFFYLIAQQRSGSIKELLGSREEGDVMFVGALEAPLTVCEDFLIWAAVLFSLAAGRRHQKRRTLLLCVGLLCLAPEVLLSVEWWVPYGSSTLLRPFLFHSNIMFWFFFCLADFDAFGVSRGGLFGCLCCCSWEVWDYNRNGCRAGMQPWFRGERVIPGLVD